MMEREGAHGWDVWVDELWCHVRPPRYQARDQGWKLHVSATRASAGAVLTRAVGVLTASGCAFKFARSREQAGILNSMHYHRGGAGKFLTAYPDDDDHFRHLAAELDAVTAGLAGPAILSDRPYRPGSLVHYRYGAFAGTAVLANDGYYRPMIVGPNGNLVEDRRDAWFNPPAGVPAPVDSDAAAPAAASPAPRSVLLADHFVVREAIRHANKGGVYRATDTRTDTDVIVKEARPHVEADEHGRDVRDALRHEAEMLLLLLPLRITPRPIRLFEQGGHVFLAEELVDGDGLRDWVADHTGYGPGLPWSAIVPMIRRLARALTSIHAAGVALRDLTPNNIMITPDGEIRIVDLELAAPFGAEGTRAGTRAYAAPEQLEGAPATKEADLHSLGAISFLLATGSDPALLADLPRVRSTQGRLDSWLAAMAADCEAARRLRPLIIGLMDEIPERRWSLERVHAFLDAEELAPAPLAYPPGPRPDRHRLIEDGLVHLLASMTPAKPRLWRSTAFGATTDPCTVQHGAAGVVAVLTQAARVYGGEPMRDALRTSCAWIERRVATEPRVLPGLYFGRSGTAWALYGAAQTLDDGEMAARALALAKRVPVTWPNPDVTHGAAGAGLTQLYLWRATGDAELGERVERCADGLLKAAEYGPAGVVWPIPASFDSALAGQTYYGFAHGVAGIAWFLLAAGLALGRDDCVEIAMKAGETLCAAAQHDGGIVTWSEGPADGGSRFVHWCHGSSGVGAFLIRLWRATGDDRPRELAEMAAMATWRTRWPASPAICHGLAGNGEFLLDLAEILDEPRYHAWAAELVVPMFACHALLQGRVVIPDESRVGVVADYGVGLAGVLAFLMRLEHGGQRMWMAEPATVAGAAR